MKVNLFIIWVLYAVYFGLLITLSYMAYKLPKKVIAKSEEEPSENEEIRTTGLNYIYAGILLVLVGILSNTYILVKGSPLESHFMEWLNIIIRVMHITFGIAWIGASFYFVFLENALNRTEDVRDELAGNLWAVHGGGFYYLEKYKIAPKKIPKDLHWFKYEAYFTWLTGFCLLFVVYYFNASAFLIDKNVLDITATQGILIGVGSFVVAWILYDQLCKSALIKKPVAFAVIGFLILIAFAWFYCHVFNSRAAYIHFGAMIGSLMVANVFFVIIPSQKAMVNAAKKGLPLDPTLGKKALARSLHNNYFTLPVLFVMVSNHFPSTFGYEYPWLILAIISLGAAGVKHYLNLKEKKQLNVWILPVSVLILLAACFVSAPSSDPYACKEQVPFSEVNAIIQKRCVQCHSASPTDDTYKVAPNGVKYDTPEDILKKKDLILQRVVITKTMPQNNKTNITEEERKLIRCWIEQGAHLE
ncbi:MAG: urate hydroxylase PuuD [Flavobacteriaceae bacterium]